MNELAEMVGKLLAEGETLSEPVAPSKRKKRMVHINQPSGMNAPEAIAHAVVSTPLQSGLTLRSYLDDGYDTESRELTVEVSRQVAAVNAGRMHEAERLLVSQALSLDAIYNQYARQSALVEYHDHKQMYLRMALQAQTNCVRTLEALAALKNPPKSVNFVEQANIAHNQQVLNQECPAHD